MTATGRPNEIVTSNERFKAVIKVTGTKDIMQANSRGYFDDPTVRKAGTIMEIELEASTLEKLQHKLKLHIDLMEDD